jgi:L-alanine-DL-glutamate epimerase-like enolase superfamily enzyme
MKPDAPIERIDVSVYQVPTDQPEADGTMQWDSTTMVVAEPVAGDCRGFGYSYTTGAAAGVIEELLTKKLLGRDALDIPGAAKVMNEAVRNVGRPGVAATAISAVDVALWDLKGKLLGQPVATLLGRAFETGPIYGSGGFTTYDDETTRKQLSYWAHDLNLPWVKIKIGESWGSNVERDLHRIALAREVIGPSKGLFVDANGGYTRGQAARVAHAFAQYDVTWYEEPVSSDDLTSLAELRLEVAPDVAAGEYGWDLAYFARMVDAHAVDCLQIDATRCGGYSDFLRSAAVAAAAGLQVSSHCAPELHLPVTLATPNLRHMEFFHDHVRIAELILDGVPQVRDGRLVPDLSRPGIGLELKKADAEQYRQR